MLTPRIRATLAVLAASAGLAGCTSLGPYGGIGVGIGNSGYGQYGYDPYYSGYGYNSGYGYDPYGWYNGYYYPGAGYWVYDRDRNRRELTPEERAYWRQRIQERYGNRTPKENWEGFGSLIRERRAASTSATAATTASTNTATIQQQGEARAALRQRAIEQRQAQQARAERQQAARAERQEARSERQQVQRQEVQARREAHRASTKNDE